jgi:hypothetical protein
MSDKEKTYRTSAFYTNGGGGYLYRFFIMSPAYQKPGYQIKEHEKGVYCGAVIRIADELSEREALVKLAELERDGQAKCKIVTGKDLDELGPDYHEALFFADQHEAHLADKSYENLKKRRPGPDFRPK